MFINSFFSAKSRDLEALRAFYKQSLVVIDFLQKCILISVVITFTGCNDVSLPGGYRLIEEFSGSRALINPARTVVIIGGIHTEEGSIIAWERDGNFVTLNTSNGFVYELDTNAGVLRQLKPEKKEVWQAGKSRVQTTVRTNADKETGTDKRTGETKGDKQKDEKRCKRRMVLSRYLLRNSSILL